MRKKIIVIFICFISIGCNELCVAQNQQRKIDSLLQVLKTGKEDTSAVNTLNTLSTELTQTSDYEKAKKYAADALQLSIKINYEKGQADAYGSIGNILWRQGDYLIALKNQMTALNLSEKIGDKKGIANAYHGIGNTYNWQDNYPDALKNYFASLKIFEEMGDKEGIAASYLSLGIINYKQGNISDALNNYLSALKMEEEIGNKPIIANCYINIGIINYMQGKFPDALKNSFTALKISEEIGDKNSIALCHNNIGEIYRAQGNYPEAKKNYLASLKIKEEIGDKVGIRRSYVNLGDINLTLGKFSEAKKYLDDALSLAKEIGSKEGFTICYASLAELDSAVGNYKQAFEYHKLSSLYKDSMLNETNSRQLNEMNSQYKSEKKDNEIALLTKDKQIQKAEIGKQRFLKNFFIGGLALLALLTVLVFNNFRVRNKLRLENIRNKIAGDLHDDIGSTLNSISIYSQVASQKSPAAVQELEQIGEASREIIDAVSDIVWTVNTKNDSFEQIIFRLRMLTYNLLKAKNIEHTFRADEGMNHLRLSMEARRNFYLIFKEALNNLVKYSNASRVSILLTHSTNFITLLIRDNGVGFDTDQPYSGSGLLNMKSRAEEMKAELKIESETGSGSSIELKLKV